MGLASSDSTGAHLTRSKPNSGSFNADDMHLWFGGTHYHLYEKLGSRVSGGETHFAVWAPNADRVSVIGEWNGWEPNSDALKPLGDSGIWGGVVSSDLKGQTYKYRIVNGSFQVDKADPFGFSHELPPRTASRVWNLDYEWRDAEWIADRAAHSEHSAPISIYEVHLGSWRRGGAGEHLTYDELAAVLPDYVSDLGFTHVELLPVMEHPFFGSWGYQATGYFAPTSRYGTPQQFMGLIDAFHQRGIAVILDWVPSHFPGDEHGLAFFDGTHLFEHADPRQGYHPDWNSYIYNFGRPQVRSFLISNALFWLDRYHIDGLRVDAVASMLYRNYSRADGEWIPNVHGGSENLEAVAFLQDLNEAVYGRYPDTQTYAEESTSWPMVTGLTSAGGLGFGYKWDMGWMHDTLDYLSHDPLYRSYQHHLLTFRNMYAFSENYVLPLSHDEVVHGKHSLANKMRGDAWKMLANLRLLFCYQFTQPGKKLLFMGAEFAQWHEWAHDSQLDWWLLEEPAHRGMSRLVGDLNRFYKDQPALHRTDSDADGFEWAVVDDAERSVIAYYRHAEPDESLLVVHNLTPIPHDSYRLNVGRHGTWSEVINSDAEVYGGSGVGNARPITTTESPDGDLHIELTLPPLASVVLTCPPQSDEEE